MPSRMSKTTYEKFAALLRGTKMDGDVREVLTQGMVDIFAEDNPRFNARLFTEAAYPPVEPRPVIRFDPWES